ncbi:MAG: IS200/IS605 family transposase [Bacteroidales bacterium]|jgi:putative transposase
MANTYSKMYVHVVFAVKFREAMITEDRRELLQKYMTGIVQKRNEKMLAIYCMPDHTHMLIGFQPSRSLSDLVRDVKTGTTIFMNEQRWFQKKFNWQEGFGCFTYSRSQIPTVARYIENQADHHRKKKFRDEYIEYLKKCEVDYNEKYLFKWLD